jgi:mannose-1-phosphate guanylyltransferase/phosphomannomutase
MAGGFGTRIQPLTNSIVKPMLPIMNRPMMQYTMMSLRDLGITEFIVLLYFKPEIIQNYFKDGSDFGIKITYVIPSDDYGTAGAVKLAQKHIGEILSFHKKKKAKFSIGITSVDNPLEFGVVIANKNNVIEKFLEKPSWGEVFSDTINTGIYVVEPEILDYIPDGENFDFAKNLFPLLMRENIKLMAHNFKGYWRDVGNPDSYRDVYEDIFSNRIKLAISAKVEQHYPNGTLYSEMPYKLNSSIEIIGNVIIGKNVTIKDNVKLTKVVIGDNVTIESESKINNSVLWNNITIGKNVRLNNSIICDNNEIGKNVNAKLGLILAEDCYVGELVRFEQDVIIWPHKKIEAASIINNNLVLGSRYKNSIFENGSVYGKSNVELSCEMVTKLAEAFASQLPVGSKVIVGCDNNKASRMLKRAFFGGLLSAGINILDLKGSPPSVLRYTLSNNDNLIGGAHFEQGIDDPSSSRLTLFDDEAIRINPNSMKMIEKSFFTEKFRRVDYSKIGLIHESMNHKECGDYKMAIEKKFDYSFAKHGNFSVTIDLMYGTTASIFPSILNDLGIKNITLNAYPDEKKLFNFSSLEECSEHDISRIVKNLKHDIGIIIHPNEQQLSLITDDGEVLDKVNGLLVVLKLLNLDSSDEKRKVFLPTWAPDMIEFENLEIERGNYFNFKADKFREYFLIATVDGNFAFTEFGVTRDAMYASLKIMQLLVKNEVKLSELNKHIDSFDYRYVAVKCTQALKGKMMRKFLEDAKNKQSLSIDGVKIWENETDWILMIPDQYKDHLNINIQAQNKEAADAIYNSYIAKIAQWSEE